MLPAGKRENYFDINLCLWKFCEKQAGFVDNFEKLSFDLDTFDSSYGRS